MKKVFTIIILAEGNVGVIVRLTTMILRRRIHIRSLNVDHAEGDDIYQFTMTITETEDVISKLMLQIDKQVEVFKTFFDVDNAIARQKYQDFILRVTDQQSRPEIVISSGESVAT